MLTPIENLPKHVFGVTAKNEVTADELKDVLVPNLERLENEYGKIHYLLVLETKVKNFTAGAWLRDLIEGIKHLKSWTRIAIVSDEENVVKFTDLFNDLAPGKSRGFTHAQLQEAKHWVSQEAIKEKKTIPVLLAGLAGAIALNITHEVLRKKVSAAPHINRLGEQAIKKSMHAMHAPAPTGKKLYYTTLGSDLLSNALYFSLIPATQASSIWRRGLFYGLGAGISTLFVPEKVGLDASAVNSSKKTQALTLGYYLIGAMVTAATYTWLKGKAK